MATIYSGAPSTSRFPFTHTHYTSNADAAAQMQMQQFRYGGYAMENQMEVSSPPSLAPPGATLGLLSKQQMYAESNAMRLSSPVYSNQQNVSSMYMQSMMNKMYQPQQPHPPPMDIPHQQTEVLHVSPGVPTPVELSIYENKQPTGFLHVTVGNQTVEFFDGVANMPQKR
ncbi:hypothetical protein F442_01117 [Phytophthora nicotianae P10297]|uniref:Uncharacterized protein n=5 Tax=Phytophthora nicotianae TaxID=4792 RepID=W2RHG1_PHYN3|nr:hypothetical protein PPTG_01001 [Phytophthora nicotianae INRA-310]ETI56237.1 hypothetical protein F443_01180 [Phytophthora nicotianae P1569]ETK96031.1 hypothetical protein L915_01116 [Phytophthora nicotianae]ETO84972.1 hypothetical protein F444_01184 [Phytophthora nicotianae P1976]ETP54065.1 hypothetical protein F442_01117 [Phytophthora nicotianae P10297]KUF77567.1 hypothetical protein AM587_10011741 [Phytophthora nicotianae]